MNRPRILLVGTCDTKSAEIEFLVERIADAGGAARVMDVGLRAASPAWAHYANTAVANAANTTLGVIAEDSADENAAMTTMAQGAALLAAQLHAHGEIDALLALGGTMGTDLALDVASALPLGVPKVVLSTVAHSHLLPPERIAPDLMMLLWAGGLYGLNNLCRASLAQASGAVVGAANAAFHQRNTTAHTRPIIGMTSLGASALRYMLALQPALEARGYELAVFHTTGMGGRAFESLAEQGRFAAVMDFSLQELVNQLAGSCVTAGPQRLTGAGLAGVPQIVAPGATDMVDYPAWQALPTRFAGRAAHTHNRLIASVCIDPAMRREVAQAIHTRLGAARGPTALLLPTHGIEEWDRPGAPLHDAQGLAVFVAALRDAVPHNVNLIEVDAHINDAAFVDAALKVFDQWVREGVIPSGSTA